MKAYLAAEIIQQMMATTVQTWLEYTPQGAPVVVYNDDEFYFINHQEDRKSVV